MWIFFVLFFLRTTAPGPPAEVKAFSATPSSLTLCWSPPLQSNGDILLYTLSIKCVSLGNSSRKTWNLGPG